MLTPVDPSTAPAPQATFGEQCRTVWRNIADTLEAAGMEVEDLVKVTTYLADHATRTRTARYAAKCWGIIIQP